MKSTKPAKKTDAVLFEFIERSIRNVDYVFLPHARARLAERTIRIEGIDPNARKIRIIVSFHEKTMPIITVMWVGRYEDEN